MSVTTLIKKNTYVDSVSLMSISTRANDIAGVEQAFVAMATEMNKAVLSDLDLLSPELADAGGSDLMIVAVTAPDVDRDQTLAQIEALLARRGPVGDEAASPPRTLGAAVASDPDANLAVIAVNGAYAAREARAALENDLHVLLFSDNVSVDDEIALKTLAHEKGLLMMGPDCGTAIINGTALCFANAVRRGPIGIVAASGTGSQEVSARIHELGGGVSQLIGTGGRDLSAAVGGITMTDGIRALAADDQTKAIVLVSKPPAPEVEKRVLAEVATAGKPVVVYFIGGSEAAVTAAGARFAASSQDAALQAVRLTVDAGAAVPALDTSAVASVRARLRPEQRYARGLFCGGTLCDESMYALLDAGEAVYSNIQRDPAFLVRAGDPGRGHTFLDFGDDEFTAGRPHPMIDPSLRLERLVAEAADPSVAVIVMDFVLGFGAHEDPVGVTLPAIAQARAQAAGRHLEIVGYVLGTDRDTPALSDQISALEAAGVTVMHSSTQTGAYVGAVVRKETAA
ncbi:acyl-CoA synthetase FdrA [Microbacterium sp. SYP-A9085]|uniref:acyl-CoA synthetase FdrA n=1 Tax=Microbacterium sp. SYP-A9085 TaxID=2664454 RepID=UPI0013244EE8|nr:acyl-CoA synthetase FdrA [Microbacterium sp. SYP-A9085]